MNGKDLFQIWAPAELEQRWTKFAKPALFVHADEFHGSVQVPFVPLDIMRLNDRHTAVIVDFSGATSVENGLGLAMSGFRPVPLYNGIHETKIGELTSVVDNTPIILALIAGAKNLKEWGIGIDAPPAFLLDYSRDQEVLNPSKMYDNRWSVGLDDVPEGSYMKNNGINRVVIWSEGKLRKDLEPIIANYREVGIEILLFSNGEVTTPENQGAEVKTDNVVLKSMQRGLAIKVEQARIAFLVLTIMAFANFFGMYFVNEEPLIWTTPSIMWLTYLWVDYSLADLLAIVFPLVYLFINSMIGKNRNMVVVAFGFFAIDAVVFFFYVLYYGVVEFTGNSFGYGVIAYGFPVIIFILLLKGVLAWKKLGVTHSEYFDLLGELDKEDNDGTGGGGTFSRIGGRGYRGYRGYGGSGTGGYGGSGYRGSGGYGGFGG